MGPVLIESNEIVRRLAETARVVPPGVELRAEGPKWARVQRRRDGLWVLIQPALLVAPESVRLGVLAHEVAHIALGHPLFKRRVTVAAVASIPLMSLGFIGALILQVQSPNLWLLLIESVIWLTGILAPRAILLAVSRRLEYQADRKAVSLLGSPDHVVALLDWIPRHSLPDSRPLILRLWGSTHPSPNARREALLKA
jgi:Zn-dependent protease with chaperone function